MARIGIVIPHHLKNLDILEAWRVEFDRPNVTVYVVCDNDYKHTQPEWGDIRFFNHKDIKKDLKEKAWIIPFRTSAIRSYGYYRAWKDGCDAILTLDNDCYPDRELPYWIDGHLNNLNKEVTLDWVSTQPFYVRGMPYKIRDNSPVAISHGLWSNIPDLDGIDMIKKPNLRTDVCTTVSIIPRWSFFSMCGMNLAFRKGMTPAMYFGLFGPDYGFDQYDDIWAGLIAKRACDIARLGVVNGSPSVRHEKQSNAFVNLRKQAPGLEMNENLWKVIDQMQIKSSEIHLIVEEIVKRLPNKILGEPDGYTKLWKEAYLTWLSLFV